MSRQLIYFLVLLVLACSPDQNHRQSKTIIYYDINGLIDDQTKALDSINPSLLKKAIIDGTEEVIKFTPMDSSWSRELMIFRTADINKPILLDSYHKQEIKQLETSTIIYTSKYPEKTEVDSLTVSYKEDSLHPESIYAHLYHENALFASEKVLELSFLQEHDICLLATYKISGWQKMITRDSTSYMLDAVINYP